MLRAVFRLKPIDRAPVSPNALRAALHRLVYHPWFDRAMLASVVANIALTATAFHGQPSAFQRGGWVGGGGWLQLGAGGLLCTNAGMPALPACLPHSLPCPASIAALPCLHRCLPI